MTRRTTKERILQAAAEVFSERGFEGTRVEAVATRAKVNKASLYYHVGDKAELYEAVLMEPLTAAVGELEKTLSTTRTPEEKLRSIVSLLSGTAALAPHLPRIILREVVSGGGHLPDSVVRTLARLFGTVRILLEEGRRRGTFRRVDPMKAHIALVGATMLFRAAEDFRTRIARLAGADVPGGETGAEGDQMADIILYGILVKGVSGAAASARSLEDGHDGR